MTDWASRLFGSTAAPAGPAVPVKPPEQTEFDLPEFQAMLPSAYELAPALPSFLGGRPRKGPKDEFQVDPKQLSTLTNIIAIAQDDKQLLDVISKTLPNARIVTDKFGNVIVEQGRLRAYLNMPGWSGQDTARAATMVTAGTLGAMGGGAIAPGAGLLARMGLSAAGVGGASAVQDLAAASMGAKKLLDPGRIVTSAAFGAGGEVIGAGLAGIYRAIVKRDKLYDAARGALTAAGREALRKLGVAATEITDDLARQFAQEAKTALKPMEAFRSAEARSLPSPVQLTRGQVTNREPRLRSEQLMREGAMGEGASSVMHGARATQQNQLRGNVAAIGERLAGGPTGIGEAGPVVQSGLVGQRQAAKRHVDTLYEAARASAAELPKSSVLAGSRAIRAAVEETHELTGLARTNALLDSFDKIIAESGTDIVAPVHIRALFGWRKQANEAMRGNAANEEGVALRTAIGAYDKWIRGVVNDDLLRGDQAALSAWREAIDEYRQYAGQFKGGDLIEALTTKASRSGTMQLKVDPADASNYIFGASQSGWIPKANLTRDLERMRELLGAESQAWKALKAEAFLRVARAGEGAMEGGTRLFSGGNFQQAWGRLQMNHAPIVKLLFNDQERALIRQFASVAVAATNIPRYSTVASGSVLIQGLSKALGARFLAYMATSPLLKTIMGPVASVKALNATMGVARQKPPSLIGTGGALGQLYQQQRTER